MSSDEKIKEHREIVINMRRQGPSQVAQALERETKLIMERMVCRYFWRDPPSWHCRLNALIF